MERYGLNRRLRRSPVSRPYSDLTGSPGEALNIGRVGPHSSSAYEAARYLKFTPVGPDGPLSKLKEDARIDANCLDVSSYIFLSYHSIGKCNYHLLASWVDRVELSSLYSREMEP